MLLPSLSVVLGGAICLGGWQPDVRLTVDPAFSSTSFNAARSIAASGAALHVIWSDDRDGNREIYYKRSLDSGTAWGSDVRLTTNAAASIFPAVATSGAAVHVVWEEYRDGNAEIYYKRSTDGGSTWGADTRLTVQAATSFSPSVAVSGSVVHVVWFDQRDGNHEIYYVRSDDGGSTWNSATRLTVNAAASLYPAIAAAGPVLHVVWEEYRDGNGEIYTKRSTDAGLTWELDRRLTVDAADSLAPAISASGSLVHVVWHTGRDGNLEIYDKRSADGGLAWGSDTRLTNDTAVSNFASVRVSGLNVHVVWFDERDGNTEIYYKGSTDGGAIWTADSRLTTDAARSTDPVVETSGSSVLVLWTDARDNVPVYTGNYEIYFKREPSGNPAGTPGSTPDGSGVPGVPLRVARDLTAAPDEPELTLTWGAACSPAGTDYAVYEGVLGEFATRVAVTCTTDGATAFTFTPASGSHYYLVVPHDGANEGSYGRDSNGAERAPAAGACRPQLLGTCP